ncbi:MAG TPA: DEAD/DEAH box helicase [Stellaceae bacterium]|nr:DEAD/DEAH box helicase [Stellaceae bacterium]
MSAASLFHPSVAAWFSETFGTATVAQEAAWPAIAAGSTVLIAAPTGSGKTLAAFLAAIDSLVRQGIAGDLPNETQIVYVSPLKALSNDIQKNLEAPLAGIGAQLAAQGYPPVVIRSWVRTGDTPADERDRMRRNPPHIVVTTPESLYILLGSESGRTMLATTRTVIVDEIHAIAPNKRGAHLAISLERLDALAGRPVQRVGLSATQKPIEEAARFLAGADTAGEPRPFRVFDMGHRRARDLAIEVPESPLEAVMSMDVWKQVYDRLAALIEAHRTTLIFVNTRRMAERVTRELSERVGADNIGAHHGSLAKERRLEAEQRLKAGQLKALVATASLELGIDIGEIDLVCQLGSQRSISSFLQRVGRSGHAVSGTPKGRLFPLSRDELVEAVALLDSVARGELDRLNLPQQPLDVLAQQIVAETAAREWDEDALFALIRRAWPYRALPRTDFDAAVRMLAEGYSTRRGRRGALVHHDAVNRKLRGGRGARLTALTSGGTIPDTADYQVLLEPENHVIGTVNEDFAVESLAGDVFQLGNAAYRILRTERGVVRVEDAQGQPPTIPFWLGEAPGRTEELSQSVSRLRQAMADKLEQDAGGEAALAWLNKELGVAPAASEQLVEYLQAGHAALGCLPTLDNIVMERFFDEAGGMQLVIHSPYGSRVNRAWGLALRKRFCRKFNFELQAAATEDNIVLSLTKAHSFPLDEVRHYLHSASLRPLLIQALLDAPMFVTRWRWVAGVSLALPRFRGGKRVPPQLARMDAEDLLGTVFPDQIACAENLQGDREVPDHPLVRQTITDALSEGMDITGLERLLAALEQGTVRIVTRDLIAPSPLALEVLAARPYAYLDDAPLEERRTQAVMSRRWLAPEAASELGVLDAEAIARVRAEAWPEAANADELHDALVWLGFLTEPEAETGSGWRGFLDALGRERRVARLCKPGGAIWITAERLPQFRAVWPDARCEPAIEAPASAMQVWAREEALVEIVRGRLEGEGPVTEAALAGALGLERTEIAAALAALEVEGFALRGRFTPATGESEWCERRLLARIHRYTLKRLRAEIEPVAARDFLRFLFDWQRVAPEARMEGPDALAAVLGQLEGFEAPAGAWESEILPARIAGYEPRWLDDLCLSGRIAWARLRPDRSSDASRALAPVRATPIALLPRRMLPLWMGLLAGGDAIEPGTRARAVLEFIRAHGASFFDELAEGTQLLRPELENALAELVALGLATSDSFGGLRALTLPADRRRGARGRRTVAFGMEDAGRWALAVRQTGTTKSDDTSCEHVARALLRRYGIVFWRMLAREASWLPPWRDLLRVYRRLEARGEIRGGRFVAGFTGEQFAVPEAIGALREARRKTQEDALLSVSGADPLNLIGILTPGARLPALTGNRVLYRDGVPVALLAGGAVQFIETPEPALEWQYRKELRRGNLAASLVDRPG